MEKRSQMEILYEKYLADDDKVLKIGDYCFYKIVSKDCLSFHGGTVMIVVPRELFHDEKIAPVMDEKGNVFELGKPAMLSFRCQRPKWYWETLTVPVKGIHNIDEIGNYLAVVE